MTGILDTVNQRTQLVGENRLELLLFHLSGEQLFGINVFKVREVIVCPKLNDMPGRHPLVRGVARLRFGTIPIIDIGLATERQAIEITEDSYVVVTEYNGHIQGFLVDHVERIVNLNWNDIMPPPAEAGQDHYLTAVTQLNGRMVEILDVERILAKISPIQDQVSLSIIEQSNRELAAQQTVLIVDDSRVARNQVTRCLETIGVQVKSFKNGGEAWTHLLQLADQGINPAQHYLMLVSDIEMPEMDGYTLTSNIRQHSGMKGMRIILHSSLSGGFNKAMVSKVGADDFIAKFDPDVLAMEVVNQVKAQSQSGSE